MVDGAADHLVRVGERKLEDEVPELPARGDGVSIPRGFAFALLDGGAEGHIACFSVHLKSNVNRTGSVQESQKNIYKREAAAGQILAAVRELRRRRPGVKLRKIGRASCRERV